MFSPRSDIRFNLTPRELDKYLIARLLYILYCLSGNKQVGRTEDGSYTVLLGLVWRGGGPWPRGCG